MEKENDLSGLKNLGMASINILNAIGIKTYQDLQRLGTVNTYLKIKASGIRISKVMLYALEGALLDVHWKDLDPILKADLLAAVESREEAIAEEVQLDMHLKQLDPALRARLLARVESREEAVT